MVLFVLNSEASTFHNLFTKMFSLLLLICIFATLDAQAPSSSPTCLPTSSRPSIAPIPSPTLKPTLSPTSGLLCPAYSATKTSSATVNFASCKFTFCINSGFSVSVVPNPGTKCIGDTFLRIVDEKGVTQLSSDDYPKQGLCSEIVFSSPGYPNVGCSQYTLQQGCYDELSCSGQYLIAGGVFHNTTDSPSIVPSSYPSFAPQPSIAPLSVRPTAGPSFKPSIPTSMPSITLMPSQQVFDCQSFFLSTTGTVVSKCEFTACGGANVTATLVNGGPVTSPCSSFAYLYNSSGVQLTNSTRHSECSLFYTLPATSGCHVYELQETCNPAVLGYGYCYGNYQVTGGKLILPTNIATTPNGVSQFLLPTFGDDMSGSYGPNNADIYVCNDNTVTISGCGPIDGEPYQCFGDTLLSLTNDRGQVVATSDDSPLCGLCASISYTANVRPYNSTNACFKYTVTQSCYPGTKCSATNIVSGASQYVSGEPTIVPTARPSFPTIIPTVKPSVPTIVPSSIPTSFPSSQDQYCPSFPLLGSSTNYTKCSMLVCAGTSLLFEYTTKNGNAFGYETVSAQLFGQNGQLLTEVSLTDCLPVNPVTGITKCVYSYTPKVRSSACQYYILKQTCPNSLVYGANYISSNTRGRCINSHQIKLIHTSSNGVTYGGAATVMNGASQDSAIAGTSAPSQNLKVVNSLAIAAIVLSTLAICGLIVVCVAVYFLLQGVESGKTSLGGDVSGRDTMTKRENPHFANSDSL